MRVARFVSVIVAVLALILSSFFIYQTLSLQEDNEGLRDQIYQVNLETQELIEFQQEVMQPAIEICDKVVFSMREGILRTRDEYYNLSDESRLQAQSLCSDEIDFLRGIGRHEHVQEILGNELYCEVNDFTGLLEVSGVTGNTFDIKIDVWVEIEVTLGGLPLASDTYLVSAIPESGVKTWTTNLDTFGVAPTWCGVADLSFWPTGKFAD